MDGGNGRAGGHRAEGFSADIDALLVFYAHDVVCHPAPGWVAGDAVCHGHEGFRRLSAVWAAGVEQAALEVDEVRDLHDRFLIFAKFTGRERTSRKPVLQTFAVINSDLRPDGKVGEVRFFLSREEALRAVERPRADATVARVAYEGESQRAGRAA